MQLSEFKKQFNQNSKFIHLNNSGQAPIPEVNRAKAIEWLDRFYFEGALCSGPGWVEVERVRQLLANFIGAQADEIAFFQTTASALSQIALSIPLKQDDEILTWQQEYPTNFYPWRIAAERAGAKIIQIVTENFETPFEKILDQITAKTKVVAVSWVQYQTGAVTDLKKLSSELKGRGIWLVADVIQGIGVRPFNFVESGFDAICCGSHKWLCSSYGAAFMAIKSERLHELQPIEFGAMTYGDPDTEKNFFSQTKKEALKFEPGSKSMIEVIAMGETIRIIQETGIENIYQEANRLAANLRNGLELIGYSICKPNNGPILNFSASGSEEYKLNNKLKLANNLKSANISYGLRGPGLRLSTHAFNTDLEIEYTLEVIKNAT